MTPDELAKLIPDEVVDAAVFEWAGSEGTVASGIRAAIAAGLSAWPGVKPCLAFTGDQSVEHPDEYVDRHMGPALLLPLPQKRETPIQHHDRRYNVAERLFGDD